MSKEILYTGVRAKVKQVDSSKQRPRRAGTGYGAAGIGGWKACAHEYASRLGREGAACLADGFQFPVKIGRGLNNEAGGGQMVEQAARSPVRGVDGAHEAPALRQQLPDGGRPHLREVGSSVHRPEVRYEPALAPTQPALWPSLKRCNSFFSFFFFFISACPLLRPPRWCLQSMLPFPPHLL